MRIPKHFILAFKAEKEEWGSFIVKNENFSFMSTIVVFIIFCAKTITVTTLTSEMTGKVKSHSFSFCQRNELCSKKLWEDKFGAQLLT
jgi:hypothetical protein